MINRIRFKNGLEVRNDFSFSYAGEKFNKDFWTLAEVIYNNTKYDGSIDKKVEKTVKEFINSSTYWDYQHGKCSTEKTWEELLQIAKLNEIKYIFEEVEEKLKPCMQSERYSEENTVKLNSLFLWNGKDGDFIPKIAEMETDATKIIVDPSLLTDLRILENIELPKEITEIIIQEEINGDRDDLWGKIQNIDERIDKLLTILSSENIKNIKIDFEYNINQNILELYSNLEKIHSLDHIDAAIKNIVNNVSLKHPENGKIIEIEQAKFLKEMIPENFENIYIEIKANSPSVIRINDKEIGTCIFDEKWKVKDIFILDDFKEKIQINNLYWIDKNYFYGFPVVVEKENEESKMEKSQIIVTSKEISDSSLNKYLEKLNTKGIKVLEINKEKFFPSADILKRFNDLQRFNDKGAKCIDSVIKICTLIEQSVENNSNKYKGIELQEIGFGDMYIISINNKSIGTCLIDKENESVHDIYIDNDFIDKLQLKSIEQIAEFEYTEMEPIGKSNYISDDFDKLDDR